MPINTSCGPHPAHEVYNLIRKEGVDRVAAIQLLGSWKTESGGDFNQCQKRGDSGKAWGLNSWHPNRRKDMPFDLAQQVHWAIHIEMPRDCKSCYTRLMGAKDQSTARAAIQESTRWGVLGARWQHADEFSKQFK